MPTVADLMKPGETVVTVAPDTTLADAARIMLAQHVSGLPVVENGKLVGIVTEGDLLRRVEIGTAGKPAGWLRAFFTPSTMAKDYVHSHGRHVRDVMTPDPATVTPAAPLADAAALMVHLHIRRIPVITADGSLAGIIGRTDLLRLLARKLLEQDDPFTEVQIREHILATLASERWAPKSGVHVTVKGDVVKLQGVVFSDEERQAVRVIAETTPGVHTVQDKLVYVDPGSGMAFPAA